MAKALTKNKEVADTTSAPSAAKDAAPEKKGPLQSFREGDVSVSIWAREHNSRVFHSCSFERSYKDATGQWRYTRYFGVDDLSKLMTLAQRASDYLFSLQYPDAQ